MGRSCSDNIMLLRGSTCAVVLARLALSASQCAPAPPIAPPPDAPSGSREPPPFYAWIVLLVLNMLSGTFSGLNLGLMSLTEDDLNIIIDGSSDPNEVRYAKRILPLRKRGNLLLCTLLIGNTLVNVMLAILTDPIWVFLFGEGTIGFVFSLAVPTTLIVIFGEIIPQAYCGRNSLFVGAISVPLVWAFVVATYPLTKPIALILDKLLGREVSNVFSRQMLLELVELNVEDTAHSKSSGLTKDDGKLLKGALTFKDRLVGDVMTPMGRCFLLPDTTKLDEAAFMAILEKGHTRVPIYTGDDPANVTAILFAKDLLGIGYERGSPLKGVLDSFEASKRVVRVARSTKLNVAMDHCKRMRTHLLCVVEDDPDAALAASASSTPTSSPGNKQGSKKGKGNGGEEGASQKVEDQMPAPVRADAPVIGLATMEDFIEELIQDEIVDETDAWYYNRQEESLQPSRLEEKSSFQKKAAPVKKVAVKSVGIDLTAHLRSLTGNSDERFHA